MSNTVYYTIVNLVPICTVLYGIFHYILWFFKFNTLRDKITFESEVYVTILMVTSVCALAEFLFNTPTHFPIIGLIINGAIAIGVVLNVLHAVLMKFRERIPEK